MAIWLLRGFYPIQLVVILLGVCVGGLLLRSVRSGSVRIFVALLLVALAVATAQHSIYWQIVPMWLAGAVGLGVLPGRVGQSWARWAGVAVLLCSALSAVNLTVLPLFRLPKPAGPYQVGTRILHLTDSSREDSTFPSHHRELMVQVWYPADPDGQPLASYRRREETSWVSSYDAVLKTHSYRDAPVAARGGAFPLVLFNPGWGGSRTQNTFQTEELASEGFVVVAIDHTHNSSPVAFPDGQVVDSNEPRSVSDFEGETLAQQMEFADAEMDREVRDDQFVLMELAAGRGGEGFGGRIDFSRVGAMGHSFGGAVALALCERDARVRSALNMDGWMFGALHPADTQKPLMVMYDSGWPFDRAAVARARASKSAGPQMDVLDLDELTSLFRSTPGYILGFPETGHMNFTDRGLYSPFRILTDTGKADPVQVQRLINLYTVAFFKETLSGQRQELLHEAPPYRGVLMQSSPGKTVAEM